MQDEGSRTPSRAAVQVETASVVMLLVAYERRPWPVHEAAMSCSRRAPWCEQNNVRRGRDRGTALTDGTDRGGVPARRPDVLVALSPTIAANGKFVGRFGEGRVTKGMGSDNPMADRGGVWPLRSAAEPYVSRYELARLMGVSVATVDRMVADGMPSVTWGRRTRRFSPSTAIGWAAERGRAA